MRLAVALLLIVLIQIAHLYPVGPSQYNAQVSFTHNLCSSLRVDCREELCPRELHLLLDCTTQSTKSEGEMALEGEQLLEEEEETTMMIAVEEGQMMILADSKEEEAVAEGTLNQDMAEIKLAKNMGNLIKIKQPFH